MNMDVNQRTSLIVPLQAARDWLVMAGCVSGEIKERYENAAIKLLIDAADNAGYKMVKRQ